MSSWWWNIVAVPRSRRVVILLVETTTHSWAKEQKPAKKLDSKNSWNWWIINCGFNDLTNFECKEHAMTGNGSYVNMLKLTWKNSWNHIKLIFLAGFSLLESLCYIAAADDNAATAAATATTVYCVTVVVYVHGAKFLLLRSRESGRSASTKLHHTALWLCSTPALHWHYIPTISSDFTNLLPFCLRCLHL